MRSGPPLTAPGGHCHFLGGELDLADPAAAVREWAGRGVRATPSRSRRPWTPGPDGLEHCAFLTEDGVTDVAALRARIVVRGGRVPDAGIAPAKPHGLLPRTLLTFARLGFSPAEVLLAPVAVLARGRFALGEPGA